MKRTDLFTKITGTLLFLALVSYLGVYIWRLASNPVQTAIAVHVTIRESAAASGIVLRDELVIKSGIRYLDIVAEQGRKVARGETIAVAYDGEASLSRANRIRALELEAMSAKTLLGIASSEDLATKSSALQAGLFALCGAVMRHDLTNIDEEAFRFSSLVFESHEKAVTQAELDSIEAELANLRLLASAGTEIVTAVRPGLFSSVLDGYEHLTLDSAEGLDPVGLRALFDSRREISDDSIGKLVTSPNWYFAAVMDSEAAEKLFQLERETSVMLEFGRYYNASISADIERFGQEKNDECVVIFSCPSALAETLTMRQASAQVIFAEYSGIRIPKNALRTDKDGNTAVYVMTGPQPEKKIVEIIYESEDFYLAKSGEGGDSLRAGNEIIISSKEIPPAP